MTTDPSSLERLRSEFGSEGSVVAVSVRSPDGTEFHGDADHPLHPASTIKIALLVSVMRMIDEGSLGMKQPLPVHNRFASLIPGEHYEVDRESDSDRGIYSFLGRNLSVWNLALRMVKVSSNLATNLLLEHVGAERVATDLAAIGVEGLTLLRGMDDTPAFERGLINQGTSRGLMQLADAIQSNRAATPRSCYLMRQAMFLAEQPWGLRAAATDGWGVAHKPGWITAHTHDFGMLYSPESTPVLMAVMTKGLETERGREAIAALALEVRRIVRPT